jgi:hypothetical protein
MDNQVENIIWYGNIAGEAIISGFPSDYVTEEIDEYSKLLDGWDYGEGNAISPSHILKAKFVYWICKIQGFEGEPHPNTDGSISLIAYLWDSFLEIEISDNYFLKLRYSEGKGDDYKLIWKDRKVPLSELEYQLLEIKLQCNKSNISLEPSTSKKTILPDNKNSEATPFLKSSEEEFQFSAKIAQEVPPPIYVSI